MIEDISPWRKIMELEEFKNARRALGLLIREDITQRIDEFEKVTGYTPAGIYVDMLSVESIGDEKKKYIVNDVSILVEI